MVVRKDKTNDKNLIIVVNYSPTGILKEKFDESNATVLEFFFQIYTLHFYTFKNSLTYKHVVSICKFYLYRD